MPTVDPSIRLWHENLRATSTQDLVPLSSLTLDEHIHGGLRLEFIGRLVPYLGYFGPDDVCFGTWFEELGLVADAFRASTEGRHFFDEGEQGQPAYLFERRGDYAFFSIVDSEFSGGQADPDWQGIQFSPHEFLAAHDKFRQSFVSLLRAEAPHVADEWLLRHARLELTNKANKP